MKIYNNNTELIDLVVSDESYRYRAIMGENALTLTFSLEVFTEIPVGSYCDFQGERYTLLRPQNFKKNDSRDFEYTLILESAKSLLGRYKFRDSNTNRLKFSYTARPQEHLAMLVWNLNQRDSGWSVGDYVESTEKVVTFNHTSCDEALRMIAEAFKTEFEVVGKQISIKKIEYNKSNPLSLSYGFGNGFKSGVKRDNFDQSKAVEVLYVQGGEKNIDATAYGSKELLLPIQEGFTIIYDGTYFEGDEGFNYDNARAYKVDSQGLSISREDEALQTHIEDSLDCSNISPSRVGTVSSVVTVNLDSNFYDFIDNSIPENLNYADCLIAGEKMTVIFQSGMLEGKEFDVSYNHTSNRFAIVPQEIDGVTMPNESFKPIEEDTYAVFGISLPTAYVCDFDTQTGASFDMLREAVKYFYDNEDPRFSFTGELDGMWAKNDWLIIGGKIKLGGFVSFTDEQFQTSPVLIRITGIKDFINNPHSPQIELSNVTAGGTTGSMIKNIPLTEVVIDNSKKETIRFAKRGFRDAQETAKMLQASLLNFSGAISPITVQTMQLLVGDESLQFRFVNSKTTPVEIAHSISYNPTTKQLTSASGILQHMSIGITSVSSSHAVSEYKFWDMSEFVSAVLDNQEQSYYLYAKTSKTANTGVFILSATPIALEQVAGYYHLLVGILNSENDGDRSWSEMYGYSEITPARLTTKKIVSPSGNVYFDLDKGDGNGEIGGNILFRAANGDLKTVEAAIGEIQVGGRNLYRKTTTISQLIRTPTIQKEESADSKNGFKITGVSNGSSALRFNNVINGNGDYIISFYCKSNSIAYPNFNLCDVRCTGDSTITTDWKKFELKATISNYGDGSVYNFFDFEDIDYLFYWFKDFKIEKGNKPTDWTPAPEDIQSQIDASKALLADIASDAKLTPNEKQQVYETLQQITGEHAGILQQATAIGIDDGYEEWTDYIDNYSMLLAYLDPLLDEMDVTSDITRSQFLAHFNNLYAVRGVLLNAIQSIINDKAETAKNNAAALDYLKAAMTDNSTVEGGMIMTDLLLMKNTSQQVSGGFSGLENDPVGIWTGGTYEQALAGIAKNILYKNGSYRLGGGLVDFDVESHILLISALIRTAITGARLEISNENNSINIFDESGLEKVKISPKSVMPRSEIGGSTTVITTTYEAHSNLLDEDGTSELSCSETITLDPTKFFTIVTPNIGYNLSVSGEYDGENKIHYVGRSNVTVSLFDVTKGAVVWSTSRNIESGSSTIESETGTISSRSLNSMKGSVYRIDVSINMSHERSGTGFSSSSISAGQILTGTIVNTISEIGLNGFNFIKSATEWLHLGDDEFSRKGYTDLPGILATGSITGLTGVHANRWGAKKSPNGATRNGAGDYYIPHTVGNTAYTANITLRTPNLTYQLGTNENNRIRVYIRNLSGVLTEADFDYVIMGSN